MDPTPPDFLGIDSSTFGHYIMTAASGLLMAAVKYLAQIARDIGGLKVQFAVMGVKEAEQDSILKAHSETLARHNDDIRNLQTQRHDTVKTG